MGPTEHPETGARGTSDWGSVRNESLQRADWEIRGLQPSVSRAHRCGRRLKPSLMGPGLRAQAGITALRLLGNHGDSKGILICPVVVTVYCAGSLKLRPCTEKNNSEAVQSHCHLHTKYRLTFEMLRSLIPTHCPTLSPYHQNCVCPQTPRAALLPVPPSPSVPSHPSTCDVPSVSQGPAQMPPPAPFREEPRVRFRTVVFGKRDDTLMIGAVQASGQHGVLHSLCCTKCRMRAKT